MHPAQLVSSLVLVADLAHGLDQAVALDVLLRLARERLHRLAQRRGPLDGDQPAGVQDPKVRARRLVRQAL